VRESRTAKLTKLLSDVWAERARIYGLTPRETEVVHLVLHGHTNKEIARQCEISELTVKDHLKHAYQKIGISQRTQLLAHLLRSQSTV
jgi:DNA-binding CsgD family transcriptional regulator